MKRHPEVEAAGRQALPGSRAADPSTPPSPPSLPAPRPSLLWPGQVRARLEHWEWAPLAFASLLAAMVRWSILDAHPYTAEAAHYAMSLHLWNGVDNVGSLFSDVRPDDFSWFFWQRPLLCLMYWPAAQFGFEAYRGAHVLVAATVPALAAVLLRWLAVPKPHAYGAALVLAVHPVLLLLALWREADGTRARIWPLRLGRFATLLLPVAVLSVLPLGLSLLLPGAAVPGFRIGGVLEQDLERLFLLVWLAPLPLIGLLVPSVRRLCLVALAWPAFFVAYHLATGKAIEVWYHVVPATVALCAAAATLGRSARGGSARSPRRWAPAAASLAVAVLLALQVAAPSGTTPNRAIVTPLSGVGQWSLPEALAYEHVREDDLFTVLDAIPPGRDRVWTALNMDYSLVMHPLATRAGFVHKDFTPEWDMPDDAIRWWADAVETRADATILVVGEDSMSQALAEAYAPCAARAGIYVSIVPDGCQGYADRLIEAWHRHHDGQGTA